MKKILLLDDNMDIVQIVEEVLTYDQYEVKSILQSDGFLSTVEQFSPDLIILDYRLADGNGGELCREIKAHPQFCHIPVIIFSAYMQPGLNLTAYGCDAVISKPFDLEDMLQTVKVLLDTSARQQEAEK
jgi:CheY-like chemotaxis protein